MTSLEENKRLRELIHLAILSIMDPREREFSGSILKPKTLIKKAIELEYFNVDLALVIIDRYYRNGMIPRKHLPRKAKKKLDRARHLVTMYDIKPREADIDPYTIIGLTYYYGNQYDLNSIYVTYADELSVLKPFPSTQSLLNR